MTVSPLNTDSAPNTRPGVAALDAFLGRMLRLKVVPALDDVLNAIWGTGFELIEAAEAALALPGLDLAANEQFEAASDQLWRSLEIADRLYCELEHLCASLEPPAAPQR
ncbi:MAG: hypothetical protein M0004_01435 [Actinomycetota bacterium]|nr:hypothetical protein [Actinomycetota bacterium]